jgi:hypothetical protein
MSVVQRAEKRKITPGQAKEWIGFQMRNRHLRANVRDSYKRDFEGGKWKLNGETIKFLANGKLVDGQHRLIACMESGIPFESYVVYGLEEGIEDTIDVGRKRTGADMMQVIGEKSGPLLSASLALLVRYETGTIGPGRSIPSIPMQMDVLNRHPEIRRSVNRVQSMPKGIKSAVTAVADYLGTLVDAERTEKFMYQIKTGVGVGENSPARHLRNRLTGELDNDKKTVLYKGAVTIKALNTALADKEMRLLAFGKEEPFPSVTYTEYGKPINALRS